MALTKRKGTIVVWKSTRNHLFYFKLLSSNGKQILASEKGFTRRNELIKTLTAVADIFTDKRFVVEDNTAA